MSDHSSGSVTYSDSSPEQCADVAESIGQDSSVTDIDAIEALVTSQAKEYVADPMVVNAVTQAVIASLTESVIYKMIAVMTEPERIAGASMSELVGCITKLLRLLPANSKTPIVEKLASKLSGTVDLQEIRGQQPTPKIES